MRLHQTGTPFKKNMLFDRSRWMELVHDCLHTALMGAIEVILIIFVPSLIVTSSHGIKSCLNEILLILIKTLIGICVKLFLTPLLSLTSDH